MPTPTPTSTSLLEPPLTVPPTPILVQLVKINKIAKAKQYRSEFNILIFRQLFNRNDKRVVFFDHKGADHFSCHITLIYRFMHDAFGGVVGFTGNHFAFFSTLHIQHKFTLRDSGVFIAGMYVPACAGAGLKLCAAYEHFFAVVSAQCGFEQGSYREGGLMLCY